MSTEFPLLDNLSFIESSGTVTITLATYQAYIDVSKELYNDDLRGIIKNIQSIIDMDILFDNKEEKLKLQGNPND